MGAHPAEARFQTPEQLVEHYKGVYRRLETAGQQSERRHAPPPAPDAPPYAGEAEVQKVKCFLLEKRRQANLSSRMAREIACAIVEVAQAHKVGPLAILGDNRQHKVT